VGLLLGRRRLAIALGRVPAHPSPSARLEQYTLTSDDAAELVWTAYIMGDVEGKVVLDLGCGTGRLALGCALLGASYVVGLDVDPLALRIARESSITLRVEDRVDFLLADVSSCRIRADVAIQNPPFGVQRRGADRPFIERAVSAAPIVYSLHKYSPGSRRFIQEFVQRLGRRPALLKTMSIRLPRSLEFHRERFHVVRVDLYRFAAEGGM
jgi:putative methylase